MRSLANLLEAAVRRSATEVLLESGQPVVFTTARGVEAEPSVLPQTELFDMIVAAADDSQQIELAVGNPVEFMVEGWSVLAEPGMEGMTVRARRDGAPSLEVELDPPDGFSSGFEHDGFALAEGSLPDDDDFEVGFEASFDAADPVEPPGDAPPSQLHVEALDMPSVQDDEFVSVDVAQAPAAPFESGTWALADEEDFDVGLDDPDEPLQTGLPDPSAFDSGNIGVPDDDDDAFDPFADSEPSDDDLRRRRTLSPTLPAVNAAVAPPRPAPPIPAPSRPRSIVETPTRREIPSAPAPQSTTRRELGSIGSPDADTLRELPSVGRGATALSDMAASIGEGALVYVQEPLAESLAQSFAAPSVTIDDQIAAEEVWTRVRGLPIGAIVIIRREDPSMLLGWILRRLEEGYRVFLETRARTPEGARRTLLGVGASERAERWLDAQITLVIEPSEAGPRVHRTN